MVLARIHACIGTSSARTESAMELADTLVYKTHIKHRRKSVQQHQLQRDLIEEYVHHFLRLSFHKRVLVELRTRKQRKFSLQNAFHAMLNSFHGIKNTDLSNSARASTDSTPLPMISLDRQFPRRLSWILSLLEHKTKYTDKQHTLQIRLRNT